MKRRTAILTESAVFRILTLLRRAPARRAGAGRPERSVACRPAAGTGDWTGLLASLDGLLRLGSRDAAAEVDGLPGTAKDVLACHAAAALHRMGAPEGRSLLQGFLKDSRAQIRELAAAALGARRRRAAM